MSFRHVKKVRADPVIWSGRIVKGESNEIAKGSRITWIVSLILF